MQEQRWYYVGNVLVGYGEDSMSSRSFGLCGCGRLHGGGTSCPMAAAELGRQLMEKLWEKRTHAGVLSLLDAGADPNARASIPGRPNRWDLWVEVKRLFGRDDNVQGFTALIVTALMGDEPTFNQLLEHG